MQFLRRRVFPYSEASASFPRDVKVEQPALTGAALGHLFSVPGQRGIPSKSERTRGLFQLIESMREGNPGLQDFKLEKDEATWPSSPDAVSMNHNSYYSLVITVVQDPEHPFVCREYFRGGELDKGRNIDNAGQLASEIDNCFLKVGLRLGELGLLPVPEQMPENLIKQIYSSYSKGNDVRFEALCAVLEVLIAGRENLEGFTLVRAKNGERDNRKKLSAKIAKPGNVFPRYEFDVLGNSEASLIFIDAEGKSHPCCAKSAEDTIFHITGSLISPWQAREK